MVTQVTWWHSSYTNDNTDYKIFTINRCNLEISERQRNQRTNNLNEAWVIMIHNEQFNKYKLGWQVKGCWHTTCRIEKDLEK